MASGLLGDSTNKHVLDPVAFLDTGLPEHIGRLVAMGVLVSIGSTRDRGAVSLTVLHDGDWDREYFRDPGDACDWLRGAAEILAGRGVGVNGQEPTPRPLPSRRRSKLS